MHVAQSGIFALGTGSHSYLEFDLLPHGEALMLVQLIAGLGEPRMTTGGVNQDGIASRSFPNTRNRRHPQRRTAGGRRRRKRG